MADNTNDTTDNTDDTLTTTGVTGDKEPATKHDVTEGGVIGAVGGAVVGMLAGGPVGAVIGAIAGGAASAAAVDVVDKHDHDYARTAGANDTATGYASTTTTPGYATTNTAYDNTATTTTPVVDTAYNTTGTTGYDNTAPIGNDSATTTGYGSTTGTTGYDSATTTGYGNRATGDDIVVPVVEEDLSVDKRQVQGGGARIHTNVIETPVEQQVTLRDETVTVDRRPVDRALTDADQPFAENVLEMEELDEEAVVSKNARVVEEVVVGKTATDRTETIRDTVRRTDVEVEQLPGTVRDPDHRDI